MKVGVHLLFGGMQGLSCEEGKMLKSQSRVVVGDWRREKSRGVEDIHSERRSAGI
jgi:hypothetical protein